MFSRATFPPLYSQAYSEAMQSKTFSIQMLLKIWLKHLLLWMSSHLVSHSKFILYNGWSWAVSIWIKIGFYSFFLCLDHPRILIADSIHRRKKNESHSTDYYDDNNNRQIIKLKCACYWVDVFPILNYFLDSVFIHHMREFRMNRIQNRRDPQMAQPRQRKNRPLSSSSTRCTSSSSWHRK